MPGGLQKILKKVFKPQKNRSYRTYRTYLIYFTLRSNGINSIDSPFFIRSNNAM
jgi:hypothetical protein